MKYYTDDELIEMVENYGETSLDSHWLANRIRERFNQKDRTVQHAQERLTVAAEHIGHQFITDLVQEQY